LGRRGILGLKPYKPYTGSGTVKVKKLRAGYYEVINKRGLLAGFIEKKRIGWDLSLYGTSTQNYPYFRDAKDEVIKFIE
jgi:hypothetical protein